MKTTTTTTTETSTKTKLESGMEITATQTLKDGETTKTVKLYKYNGWSGGHIYLSASDIPALIEALQLAARL